MISLLHRSERRPTRAPRLVLRFALFTAIGLSIASVAIFLLVKGFVTTQARDSVEKNTRFVAEAVLPKKLTPTDFAGAPQPARRAQLDRLFRTQVMLDDVERVSLYGLDGRVGILDDVSTYRPPYRRERGRPAISPQHGDPDIDPAGNRFWCSEPHGSQAVRPDLVRQPTRRGARDHARLRADRTLGTRDLPADRPRPRRSLDRPLRIVPSGPSSGHAANG